MSVSTENWDVEQAELALRQMREVRPDVFALAMVASLARRIEPELLRALRFRLHEKFPDESRPNVSSESGVWFSSCVESRGPDAITFLPEYSNLLRNRLCELPDLLESARTEILDMHRNCSPVLVWEEELVYLGVTDRLNETHAPVLRAFKAVSSLERPGLEDYIHEMGPRLPKSLNRDPQLTKLRAFAQVRVIQRALEVNGDNTSSSSFSPTDFDWSILPTVTLEIAKHGQAFRVGNLNGSGRYRIEVPRLEPIILVAMPALRTKNQEQSFVVPRREFIEIPITSNPLRVRAINGHVFEFDTRAFEDTPIEVFLSHNSRDKAAVEVIKGHLERGDIESGARRINCWYEEDDLRPGESWVRQLEERMAACGAAVAFYGPEGIGRFQENEIEFLLDRAMRKEGKEGLRLVPVLLPGAQENAIQGFMKSIMWVDFRQGLDDEAALSRLRAFILGEAPPSRPDDDPFKRLHDRIRDAAREWENARRNVDYLWVGSQLDDLLRFMNAQPDAMSKLELAFAQASISRSDSRTAKMRADVPPADRSVLYPIWFGTIRTPHMSAQPNRGFAEGRDNQVNFGICNVTIPKSHKLGSLGTLAVARWSQLKFEDDSVRLNGVKSLASEDFLHDFSEALSRCDANNRDVLVYLHGYNISFEQAARRAAQLGFDLKVPGITAMFSWPSQGKVIAYLNDAASIEASEIAIAEFLTTLTEKIGAARVHVIADGMGNRGLLRAMQRIHSDEPSRMTIRFGQIFLAAPDIDSELFREMAAVCPLLCERTTMYVSTRDLALVAAQKLDGRPRAGLTPPVTVIDGIDTVDVSSVAQSILGHSYFGESEVVLQDMNQLLIHGSSPENRQRLAQRQTADGKTYWALGGASPAETAKNALPREAKTIGQSDLDTKSRPVQEKKKSEQKPWWRFWDQGQGRSNRRK